MAGSSSGSSRPRARRGSRALPSRRRSSCAARSLSRRPPGDRAGLLLDLGMAEASAGLADWPEHLQRAVDAAPNAAAAAEAAMVLALALSRAQRFAEAVEVLDRAASCARFPPLRARAPARGCGRRRRDERPRYRHLRPPSVVRALRERAADDPGRATRAAGRRRLHLRPDERARRGRRRARDPRASRPETAHLPGSDGRPWFSYSAWFSQATFALLWAERYAQVRPLLDGSIAQARATGDSGPACRRPGEPRLARAATRRSRRGRGRRPDRPCRDRAPRTTHVPRHERRCAHQGARRSGRARCGRAERSRRSTLKQRADRSSPQFFASRAAGCGSDRDDSPKGSRTSWPSGYVLTRALVTCPSSLPWRSEAALAHLALGDREAARTPRRRGARARPGIRRPARARRGEARRRRRGRRRPWRVAAPRGHRRSRARRRPVGKSARSCRPRRPASAAQPPHRSSRAPPRGARRRPPLGRQTARRIRRDRAPRHRRAPAPGPSDGARLADRQRAPCRRARQRGPHQPRDRTDAVHHRTHGRRVTSRASSANSDSTRGTSWPPNWRPT